MKFPLFAIFLVFIAWLAFVLHRNPQNESQLDMHFWDRERLANATRKQPLDNLEFIIIPDNLPLSPQNPSEKVQEQLRILAELSHDKIVNLTGISNTDLKLQYGVANLDLLTRYDNNYLVLARTLQILAQEYYDLGLVDDAKALLEFAMFTRTDNSKSYQLLCQIYKEQNESDKIENLLPIAESLQSATKPLILRNLKEALPTQ